MSNQMNSALKFRTWVCTLITIASLYFLAPTGWSLLNPDSEKLPSWMLDTAMRLGLDLKGGVHMVLGVDLNKVVLDQLGAHGRTLEKNLKDKGIEVVDTKVNAEKAELETKLKNPADTKKFEEVVTTMYTDNLQLLSAMNGTEYLRLTPQAEERIRDTARNQSIETIRNRIDEFGVSEPLISKRGEDQILVQFPGAKEPERLKALIGETAKLNFHIVHGCTDSERDCIDTQKKDLQDKIEAAEKAGNYKKDTFERFSQYRDRVNKDLETQIPKDTMISFEKENDPNEIAKTNYIPVLLSSKDIFSGEFIDEAAVHLDGGGGGRRGGMGGERPVVSFHINAAAAKTFEQFTGSFVGHYMAIVLDGVVKSKPVLQSAIGDSGQITLGNRAYDETMQEAQDLSIVLRAGALPASIEIQEERVIGPSMGRDAIESGKVALLFSFIFVIAFMIVYYGFAGVVAAFVTFVNIAMIFALLGSLHATLTLPGIAGIVLTIGVAVDALVIIFERMREETRLGRSVNQVIEVGFDKAFSTIVDSNMTTLIGALVLLSFGTGSIRGFAFTLIVGICTNVFMATYYSKTIFLLFFRDRKSISLGLSHRELTELGATKS